ncbi:hypothetical protein GOP47_0016116 [Adiantum capillus-veneris]|uniref:Pentatricopeptide repeat-containing protein n=1 Tax=Adiantum capillus-veneris TaxID=13818 RepID=A0A9D4UL28_ADICA|nr:hypothetical protein GOP47_0016116 [Adiantum capillus-veneris]
MIPRRIGRRAFHRRNSLQGVELFSLLSRLGGHRWLSANVEDQNLVQHYLTRCLPLPVYARSRQRPKDTYRLKPVSVPLADHPVEIQQLVSVVRRKGKSADLDQCLDALAIRITPHHVSKALALIGDAEYAVPFFGWAVQQPGFSHNVYTCMSFVTILARAKQFDKIWEILSEMHMAGSQLTDGCFNITIKAYGEMGKYREAVSTLHKMREFEVLPTAHSYNTLISVLVKSQKVDLAMEVYCEMLQASHVKEEVFSSSMMVSALCNAGRLHEAHEMAVDAAKRGFLTSIFTWNSFINGLCKAGKVEEGIELFSMMKDMGNEPNEVTYGIIIHGLCKVGKLSDAMAYLGRMKSGGLEATAIIYTPLLDAMCKAGRTDEAHDLLKTLSFDDGNSNTILYSIFLKAYSQQERMDEACAMYDKMVKNGCRPCIAMYGLLMQGLCKVGRLTEALKIFKEMKEARIEPNAAVYQVMVQGLAKAGLKDGAEEMFQEMLAQGFEANGSTCRELIKCFCQQGSLDIAKKTLGTIFKKDSEVQLGTACILLKGLCNSGQMDSAFQFFEEMLEHGIEPSTLVYNILINGAFKAGDLERAVELCSEMRSKGCDPNICTYAELCKIAWKAKRADVLFDIYHDMRQQCVFANPFVFTIIIKALCRMNKVPEACSLCSQIFEDGFVSSDNKEQSSGLDHINFIELELFLPLLMHLQESGNAKEMANLWDSILQRGFFSWIGHSDITL